MGSAGETRYSRDDPEAALAALASAQHGVFSGAQAAGLGVSKARLHRRVASGRLQRVHRGVYRIGGAPQTWHQALMAAALAFGGEALVSHAGAAALWRLAGFVAGPVELTVPRSTGRVVPGAVGHRPTVALVPSDAAIRDGIPVTSVARTLVDVAGVVDRRTLEIALDDTLRRKLVSLARLRWRIGLIDTKRAGVGALREMVELRAGGGPASQSPLETSMLSLLRHHRLPMPEIQHAIRDRGRVVATVDFAFPQARLAIETDGHAFHSGRIAWEHDLARQNEIIAAGWRVLRFTWTDLEARPERVAAEIGRLLEA